MIHMIKLKISLILLFLSAIFKTHAQENSYDGKYVNNDGAILTIVNFTNGRGFDFTYEDNSKGKACSGQSWEGKAKLNSEKEAVLLNEAGEATDVTFSLEENNISFNIDMYIFGMECQKFFDPGFVKKVSASSNLSIIKAKLPVNKYKDWGKKPIEDMGPADPWCWTHGMCYGPEEDNINASTTLAPQGKFKYLAKYVCDDDPTTAWVEGNADYGIGECLEFKNWIPMGNGEISILNGYQATRASWENNSRVKKFKISINGKDVCILELGDVMGVQTFNLPANILKILQGETKIVHSNAEVPEGASSINDGNGNIEYTKPFKGSLRFTILEVFPGLKWKDTAISGIFSCGG